jgi:hypothetical protein
MQEVRIRFLKPWGHPTRDLICGTGDVAKVSQWIANNLINSGYAEPYEAPGTANATSAAQTVAPEATK